MNDNKRRLYNALSKEYDLGSFEDFSSDIEDEGKRRKLYDATSNEYDYGDYDSFSEQLGYPKKDARTVQWPASKPVIESEEPAGPAKPEAVKVETSTANSPAETVTLPSPLDTAKEQAADTYKAQPAESTGVQTSAAAKRYADKVDTDADFSYNFDDEPQGPPQEDLQRKMQEDATRAQVASLRADVDKQLAEAVQQSMDTYDKEEEEARKGGFFKYLGYSIAHNAGNPAHTMPRENLRQTQGLGDPELHQRIASLTSAQNSLKDAQRIIDEADHNAEAGTLGKWLEQSFAGGAVRGMGQQLFDTRNWDGGLSDADEGAAVLAALDKVDAGEELTGAERAMLDAKSVKLATDAYFGSYLGRGYKAGQVTAESIPFMLEMVINPASSMGKAATSRLTRYALERFGKKAAAEAIEKGTKGAVLKGLKELPKKEAAEIIAKRVGADIAGSAAMAATTGATNVLADTESRMAGLDGNSFSLDDNGYSFFNGYHNGEDFGTALLKAYGSTVIENHSEMLGEYFAPVLGIAGKKFMQGLDKIGLDAVTDFIRKVPTQKAVRMFNDFMEQTKWSGTIGEFAEEIAGGIENALFVGDQTLDADPETGIFNPSQMLDTFLGVALMGGAVSAMKTAGYVGGKYATGRRMRAADAQAEAKYGEAWSEKGGIKDQMIKAVDDRDLTSLSALMDDEDFKGLKHQFVKAYMANQGATAMDMRRRTDGMNPAQFEAETSYDNGYSLTEPQEMNDAQNMLQYRRQQLKDALGVEDITAEEAFSSQDLPLTAENKRIVLDYINAKATYEGMVQKVKDDIEDQVAAAHSTIDANTNVDSKRIQPATMKAEDKKVYVVGGKVAMLPDGTGIDRENSDESVIVRDAVTGQLEMVSPADILSIDEEIDPVEEKNAVQEEIRNNVAQKAADKIDGKVDIEVGQQYTLTDDKGNEVTYEIARDPQTGLTADYEAGYANAIVVGGKTNEDGSPAIVQIPIAPIQEQADAAAQERLSQFLEGKAEAEAAAQEAEQEAESAARTYDMGDEVTLQSEEGTTVRGSITSTPDEDGRYEVYTEDKFNGRKINYLTKDELDAAIVEYNGAAQQQAQPVEETAAPQEQASEATPEVTPETPATTEAAAPATEQEAPAEQTAQPEEGAKPARAIDRIPTNETGEPVFEQGEVVDTWQALLDMNEGDSAEAKDTAEQMLKQAKAEQEKLSKQKPKTGGTVFEIQARKAEAKKAAADAQQKADYWQSVVNYEADQAATAKAEAEAEAQRAAVEQKKIDAKLRMSNARQQLAKGGRYREANKKLGEPLTLREHILRALSTGRVKLKWANDPNNTAIKGLSGHLGFGKDGRERRSRIWMLSNSGLNPEEAAEQLLQEYAEAMGAQSVDDLGTSPMDALNELLDVARSFSGPRAMFDEAVNEHHRNSPEGAEETYRAYQEEQAEAQQQMKARADLEQATGEILRETEGDEKLLSVAEDEELQKFNDLYNAYMEANDKNGMAQDALGKAKQSKEQKTIEAAKKKAAAAEKAAVKAFKPLEDFYKQLAEKYDLHSGERQADAVQEEVKEDLPEDLPEDNTKQEEQPQQAPGIDEQIAHLEEIKNYPGADKKSVQAEIDRLKAAQGIAQAEQVAMVANDGKRPGQFQYFNGTLSELIQAAKGEAKGLIKKIIAPVSSRLKADLNEKGVRLTDDYRHTLDNSAIIHTMNEHGGESEFERGQIPITDADFERISDVVENYDDITVDDGKRGLKSIVYSKTYPDGTTVFVEEVRSGRKELAAVSMWKKKSPTLTDANRNNATPISDLNKASSEGKDRNISETSNNQEVKSSENIEAERRIQEPASKFQAGDKVMYKGKEMEVVRAHGDKLDLKYDPTGVLPVISVGIDASEVEAVSREADKETTEEAEKPQEQAKEETATDAEQREGTPAEAQSGKAPLGTIRTGKHTKTGEALWIVTPADRVSKEDFTKLKASAKEHGGYYSSFKPNNGFLFKSEEDAKAFNEENARVPEKPITHAEMSSVVGTSFSSTETKAGPEATKPRWRYDITYSPSGRIFLRREDVNGVHQYDDSKDFWEADSPAELTKQLSDAGEAEVLEANAKDLDYYQRKYEFRQKAENEGFHGYKIGDKVFYNPAGHQEYSGTVIGFAEYGDHLPLLDTGQAPVMSVVALLHQVRHADEGAQEPKPAPAEAPKAQSNPSGNKLVSDERYAELKRRMMEKLKGQMNMGIDPEILAIGTEMAVYHIEKGARKFAEYAKAMVSELGDLIRPYLKAFYNGARDLPEMSELAKEMTPYDEVSRFDTANFDKQVADLFSSAATIAKEQEVEQQAEQAKDRIKTAVRSSDSKEKSVSSQKEQSNTQRNELPGRSTAQDGSVGEGEQPSAQHPLRDGVAGRDNENPASDEGRSRSVASAPARSDVKKNRNNNHVGRGESYVPATASQRIDANIAAIRKMRELMDAGKKATRDDMAVLRQYSGWGGLGSVFNKEWSPENRELKELLSEDEYRAAVMSANSAYYTPTNIIDAMWDAAKNLGFTGGKVLEGSAGIGNIIASMPKNMSEASDITAVEIDSVSGNILKLLYPDADVHISGFEETDIPNNSIDLAITNVPFVTGLHVFDKVEKDLSRKFGDIHDFCIAKNVRKLKEGGIGIFITSKGTLDKSKALRNWVVNEGGADFIGAFRLNNDTFEGTSVTSDIIVIRKRVDGRKSPNAIDVSGTAVTRKSVYEPMRSGEKDQPVIMEYNSYFVEHPENMAGEMKFAFEKGETFRPTSTGLYAKEGTDQDKALAKWVKSLRNDAEKAKETAQAEPEHEKSENVKEGQIVLNSKGEICISRRGKAVPLGVNANKVKGQTKAQVLKDYDAIKTALDEVLDYQTKNSSDEGLKPLLKKLNAAYDNFVSKYGPLNKNSNIAFLREDVDFAALSAIEGYKEVETIDGKKNVETVKSDVFSRRVVGYRAEPSPTTAKEGVIVSINQFGRIDLGYIADKLGRSVEDVRREILDSGYGFENPLTGAVEVSYEYLSGNVREKLEYARSHNENGRYDKNIQELEKVIPLDIPAHLIEFSLGSDWLDKQLYIDFAREKYGVGDGFDVANIGGVWQMREGSAGYEARNEKNRSAGVSSSVTGQTAFGHDLMLNAMNNTQVTFSKKVKDFDGSEHTVYDKEASQAATERIAEIRDEFKEWCRDKMLNDEGLAEKVQKKYNDLFNAIVPKEVGTEFLPEHFEGSNMEIKLYPHQGKAVVRGTTEPLMLAHEVGSGKTFTLITTAMEMKRLGTAKKPMIVVLDATVGQFVTEAKKLYPNAKVLTITERDRTREGRSAFYAKIKYNDWDLIIIPQTVFNMIPDSEERQREFIQDKIDEKMHALQEAREAGADNKAIRQIESELKNLETWLNTGEEPGSTRKRDAKKEAESMANAEAKAKRQLDRKTDEVADFDAMDIDALLIDEAHQYKKLGFSTSLGRNVKGVDTGSSKRAASLFLKTRSVFEKAGWKNVVFATGTPISNTAAEIWTFMKYLMPADRMRQNHIYYFDDFVRNFGKIEQSLEFATNGKFKETTRFGAYINLPELVRIWGSVSDTVLSKDAEAASGKKLADKLPELEGGKAEDIFLPQSPSLIGIMRKVRATLEEYEKLSGKEKREKSYIPITMYGIAKRAAIDPRLVDPSAADEPNSKTNRAVEEILKDLKATGQYKGTVAVFCDMANRHEKDGNGRDRITFNIFEDMKRKLVAAGVPANQIVIMETGMTDAAKQKTFAKVNDGDVRVILGSTATLGTGVNIQRRLHMAIHMDAPDRPMDYTQRNGRILRQGNLHKDWNKTVRVLRFGVEDSLDVTSYQRLKTKAAFIDSVMDSKPLLSNAMENRILEEEEEGLFDNPVARLSGSQYAQLKSQAERELRKYQNKQKQYQQDQIYIENQLRGNKAREEQDKRYIEDYRASVKRAGDVFAGGKVKTVTVAGVRCKTDEEIKAAIAEKINKQVGIARESARTSWGWDPKDLHYSLEFDGVKVNVKVTVSRREASYLNGDTKPSSQVAISYTCPELFGNSIFHAQPKDGIMGIVDRFRNDFATGKYQQAAIAGFEADIERMASDNALMLQRRGVPFAETDKLAEAQAKVAEYTVKMKEEMAEKEKKYAEAQAAETDLDVNSIDIEDEETGKDAQFQTTDEELGIGDDAQQLAFDTVTEMLSNAGIPVEQLSDEAMRKMAEDAEIKEKMLDTALPEDESSFKGTVVSSTSGAKVLKDLDNAISKYENKEYGSRNFLGDAAAALGATKHGSNSQYATFETKNGRIVTIRLSNHNAKVSTFDKHNEAYGISIVVSRKPNEGVIKDGDAGVMEYFYPDKDLRKAEGKPLAEILKSIKQALYSGEYKDTTGLAEVEPVNIENIPQFMTVYHGSGAKFDKFDSSHMGEGEGAQAYGWGHYVTEVEGIGKAYASGAKRGNRFSTYKGKGLQELFVREPKTAEEAKNWAAWGVLRDMEQGASFEESVGRNRRYLTETIELIEEFLEENQWLEEHDKAERRRTIEMYRSSLEVLNTFREEDFSTTSAVLYTVDIPDDNGTNYLDWGKTLPKAQRKQIADHLRTLNDSELTREQHGPNWLKEGWNTLANTIEREQYAAKEIVEKLRDAVGSPRRVSEILSESGFVGIKIPTYWQTRGFQDGTYNYTIFKDTDLEIKSHIQFLRDGDVVYGAAVGGKIYLNAEHLNPNTPIHEYTHLWDKVCKAKNPELWKRGVELMKQTSLWEEVKRDPNYKGLNDEGIASEVHSRLTGEHGAELLERLSREAMEANGGVFEKAGKVSVIAELKHWLSSFWHWVKDTMAPWSREEAGRVSLEDFINMPLVDLAKGTRVADIIDGEDGYASFSIVNDKKEIDRLNSEPTIKTYRAMQLHDGVLYPPMAGKVNGKWQQGIAVEDLGEVWEKSDEHPELADNKGYFKLDKGNGKSLKARYNPYFHTSLTPLNDQFAEAQDRPELVTVEVEVPESELTSGYKAEKAKDSVGKVKWPAGAIQKKLTGTRTVILSRWDKPVRIVPDSEVADVIVKMFGGKDITMPSNVVTPQLRSELEKRGIPFVDTDNQGKPVEIAARKNAGDAYDTAVVVTKREEGAGRFRGPVGGNSGYVGYSMSKRAAEAREEGRFPKGDFCKEYGVSRAHFDTLVKAGVIDNSEWHHTSSYGNKTEFYEWAEPEYREMYEEHKREIGQIISGSKNPYEKWLEEQKNLSAESENALYEESKIHDFDKEAHYARLEEIEKNASEADRPILEGLRKWEQFRNDHRGQEPASEAITDMFEEELGSKRREQEQAKVDAAQKLGEKLGVKVNVVIDAGSISDQNKRRESRKRTSKGWYDINSHEVYVVVPNNTDAADVEATILHEIVGHKGMRELVGDANYKDFLDKVYRAASPELRRKIADLAMRNGGDFNLATEEYIAGLAESGFKDREERNLLERIRDLFVDMFRRAKIAAGLRLNDNDLRYMLWRAYKGRIKSALDLAEDISMQMEMQTGDFAKPNNMNIFNKLFNRKNNERVGNAGDERALRKKNELLLRARTLLRDNLGAGEEAGRDAGEGKRRREEERLLEQAAREAGVWIDDVDDYLLNKYGNMFARGEESDIYLNLSDSMVAKSKAVTYPTINEALDAIQIQNDIFPEAENDVVGFGRSMDGEFRILLMQDFISIARPATEQEIADYIKSKGLAKVDGKNYTYTNGKELVSDLHSGNVIIDEKSGEPVCIDCKAAYADNEDGGVRFRPGEAKDTYEAAVRRVNAKGEKKNTANLGHRLQEAYQDSMLALKEFQNAVAKETGNPIEDFENAYMAENAMSSKNKAQADIYERKFFKPLRDTIKQLLKAGVKYNDIVRYVMAKHGLERNEYMAKKLAEEKVAPLIESLREKYRDADMNDAEVQAKYQEELDKIEEKRGEYLEEYRKRDFSGLTGLTESEDNFKEEAELIVSSFERDYYVDELWARINAATKETLRKNYESGLMNRATYEKVRDMFQYYIPLRGWNEGAAEDEYDYLLASKPLFTPALKSMKGRISMADDPFATILYMADSTIALGNRNMMKQKFLNFVQNNPTSLATVSKQWYTLDPVTGEWKPNNPYIPEDATDAEITRIIEQFNEQMQQARQQGWATTKRDGLKLAKHITPQEGQEHTVRVKRNGEEYVIYINGNPRVAQAVNGLTNAHISDNLITKVGQAIKNFQARVFTSLSPAFIVTNLSRDLIWAAASVAVKENAAYNAQYQANIVGNLATGKVARLIRKLNKGEFDESAPADSTEKYFREFIENGGETGYTRLLTVDDHKKEFERLAKDIAKGAPNVLKKGWDAVWDGVEFMNRCAEDTVRFTVYMTSRQMGRSVARSIYDAKEVTVNFNKKGAGGYLANVMNYAYIFFNAAVQSVSNFGRLFKNHPEKMTAAVSTFAAMGALTPMLAAATCIAFGDGDDDDAYWDIPEWVRRNNIIFRVPFTKTFITIPLPHELRPFYGIGEIALSCLCGKEDVDTGLRKAMEGFTSMLPLDFTGNGGKWWINFIPTALQPAFQIGANTDFFGVPIYKKNDFNELDPDWTKAYKGTNSWLVEAAKWVNGATGGDNVRKGAIDINPAIVEHLYESYLGGVGKTLNRMAKTFSMIWDEDMREWRNVPIASSFVQQPNERTQGSQLNRQYYDYLDEYEKVQHDYSGYKKQIKQGNEEYEQKLNDLIETDEFKRYEQMRGYVLKIRELNTKMKQADEAEAEELKESIEELKREAVGMLQAEKDSNR